MQDGMRLIGKGSGSELCRKSIKDNPVVESPRKALLAVLPLDRSKVADEDGETIYPTPLSPALAALESRKYNVRWSSP